LQGLLKRVTLSIADDQGLNPLESKAMKILLATDGSAHAQTASEFLKRLPLPADVELTVMTVLSQERQVYPDEMLITDEIHDLLRQWRAAEQKAAQQRLAHEAEGFASLGWAVTTRVEEGHVAEQILRLADGLDIDLIAVGARGLSAIKRFLLGSVSEKVMRHATCSVLIARTADEQTAVSRQQADDTMRILVAYDTSPAAQTAIDMLQAWPLPPAQQIHLITVLTLITYYRMDLLQQLSAEWLEEKRNAQANLERAANRLRRSTPNITMTLEEGTDPGQIIIDAAIDFNAALLMLGHAGKSGIERIVLGSVANRVVHHAPCSVLLVR
jgi:nucleotide-binding universal stress UspA family protein